MSKAFFTQRIGTIVTMVSFGMLLMPTASHSQVATCPAIACNDEIQISLDQECDFLLDPSFFLEGDIVDQILDPNENFTISISSLEIAALPLPSQGSVAEGWNSDKLFGSHLYKIENDCRNSCWGTVTIESKLPPRVINDPAEIWTFNCSEIFDVLNSDEYTDNWGLNPELSEACQTFNYNMYFKDAFSQLPNCADETQSTYTSMLSGKITDDLQDDLLLIEDQHFAPDGSALNMFNGAPITEWRADLHVAPDVADCNLMVDIGSELKYLVSRIDGTYDWVFADLEVYVYTVIGNNIVTSSQLTSFPASVDPGDNLLVRASHPNAEGSYKLTFSGDCTAGLENNVCVRNWYVSSMDHGVKTEQLIFQQKFKFNSLDLAEVSCPTSGFVVACDVSNEPDSLYEYFKAIDSDSAAIVNSYPHILTNKRKIGIVKVDSIIHEEIPIDTIIDKVYLGGEWVLIPIVTKEIRETIVRVERKVEVPIIIPLPPGSHQCNIVVAKDDVEVPICGYGSKGSHKVVRTWSVIDWCSEETKNCTQVFEVRDTEAPEVELYKDKITVSVDPWQCKASVFMPPIHVSDNCNVEIDLAHDKSMEVHMQLEHIETGYKEDAQRIWEGDMEVPAQIIDDYQAYPMGFAQGMSVGMYWVHYTVYDECGNKSLTKKTLLEVVDDVPPVAVCPEQLAVTLIADEYAEGGAVAKVPAASFNNGSHDAGCNEVYIKVIRMDELEAANSLTYGLPIACEGPDAIVPGETDKFGVAKDSTWLVYFDDHVKFCCGDESVVVVLRVFDQDPGDGPISPYDYVGNYNDCMISVNVSSQAPHLKHCAPERYVDCEDDIYDMDKMGKPALGSSCDEHAMMYRDTDYGDASCGRGRVERAWYYDMNYNGEIDEDDQHMCSQSIYLTAHTFDPTSIKWPSHYTGDWVSGIHVEKDSYGFCTEKPHEIQLPSPLNCADDIELCTPEWQDVTCGLIGYNVDVDTLKVPNSGGCSKIIYKWTIIDWCNYDPNEYNPGSNHYNERYEAVKDDCADEGCIAANEYGTYFRYSRVKNAEKRDSAAIVWDGYYTWEQVVKIVDDQLPIIDDGVDVDAELVGSACTGGMTITKHAVDTGCISELSWDVSIEDNEGATVAQHMASGSDLSWTVPDISAGTYKVKYVVSDGCQNTAYEEDTYTVNDNREPTPYCIAGVSTAVMQGNGEVTIWASDFDLGAYDNCDESRYLRFTFSDTHPDEDETYNPDQRSSALSYSCSDLNNGVTVLELRVYVWDTNDNRDYCTVDLRVDDNESICSGDNTNNHGADNGGTDGGTDNGGTDNGGDNGGTDNGGNTSGGSNNGGNDGNPVAGQTARISGVITTQNGGMIHDVNISINSTLSNYPKNYTSQSGLYAFEDNPMEYNYVISAFKDDDYLNGVSTLDLVLIQQHILGLKSFDDGYKVIAADANNDQNVSASDIVQFRQLILGLIEELPLNDSWRFVDAKDFLDQNNPWPFTEELLVSSLFSNSIDQNFIGIKIGDVNGNVQANNVTSIEQRSSEVRELTLTDRYVEEGEYFTVDIETEDLQDIHGLQANLQLTGLDLYDISSDRLVLSDDNFNYRSNESVVLSADKTRDVNREDGNLLSIKLQAKTDGLLSEMISIGNALAAEAYVGDELQVDQLELVFENQHFQTYELSQNQPNPFTETTYVKFVLPTEMEASFRILDVSGKEVFTTTQVFKQGQNEIRINKNELNTAGILYYQLYTKEFTSTRKMILLE